MAWQLYLAGVVIDSLHDFKWPHFLFGDLIIIIDRVMILSEVVPILLLYFKSYVSFIITSSGFMLAIVIFNLIPAILTNGALPCLQPCCYLFLVGVLEVSLVSRYHLGCD